MHVFTTRAVEGIVGEAVKVSDVGAMGWKVPIIAVVAMVAGVRGRRVIVALTVATAVKRHGRRGRNIDGLKTETTTRSLARVRETMVSGAGDSMVNGDDGDDGGGSRGGSWRYKRTKMKRE